MEERNKRNASEIKRKKEKESMGEIEGKFYGKKKETNSPLFLAINLLVSFVL